MSKLAAIILAAGKGTRMKSSRPKVVFELAGKPMVNRVIETAKKAKCDKIVTVVGYKKDEVIDVISKEHKCDFVEQKEQNGTGHAVMVAKDVLKDFDGTVFILCGDVPLLKSETLTKMLNAHKEEKASCTVLTSVMDDALKYGRIVRNKKGNVLRIVEFKDATDEEKNIKEINTGIYCFESRDLFEALSKINNNNAQNEYYLTDTLEVLNNADKKVISVNLENMVEASGINSQKQLSELEMLHYRNIAEAWMEKGVKIENPISVLISDESIIYPDVKISANCAIKGKSVIKEFAQIGPNSVLIDAIVEENANLKGFNLVDESIVNKNEILDFGEMIFDEE